MIELESDESYLAAAVLAFAHVKFEDAGQYLGPSLILKDRFNELDRFPA
jgi:hypothetical protein